MQDDQITQLQAENARLRDIAQTEPGHAFLEAAQRAIVERHDDLKHGEREARARAEKAERQLDETQVELERLRRLAETYRRAWNVAEDQLADARAELARQGSLKEKQ